MKVIVTGGGGFLGNQLARAISHRGELIGLSGKPEPVEQLVLFDRSISDEAREGLDSGRTYFVTGDISERFTLEELIDETTASVFHLASVVSGEGERDFDLAMKVNLDGGRMLFDALRKLATRPRLVFASSIAAFGGSEMPDTVGDSTKVNPQTTYGMTKVIGELMINDYSRKGFLDGRAARLPTVVIRPGRPNAAASSFASGVFREPLGGQTCELPVPRDQKVPVIGYRTVVESLLALHELSPGDLGSDRVFTLPSLELTVAEMITTLEQIADERGLTLGPIKDQPDPEIQAIVEGWPTATDGSRAIAKGLPADRSLEAIIEAYLEDFGAS